MLLLCEAFWGWISSLRFLLFKENGWSWSIIEMNFHNNILFQFWKESVQFVISQFPRTEFTMEELVAILAGTDIVLCNKENILVQLASILQTQQYGFCCLSWHFSLMLRCTVDWKGLLKYYSMQKVCTVRQVKKCTDMLMYWL